MEAEHTTTQVTKGGCIMIRRPAQPSIYRGRTRPAKSRTAHAKARRRAIGALHLLGGALAAIAGLGWAGVQVRPAPFASVPPPPAPPKIIRLPAGLPAPVARYYRATYGERVPL